jgi:hypothetical protein
MKNKIKTFIQKSLLITTVSALLLLGITQGIWTTLTAVGNASIKARERAVSYIGGDVGDYVWAINVPRVKAEVKPLGSVEEKIIYYADIYGVEKETALRIAKCESGFNPKAENENGSATGVYQFIRKTWKNNCDGDVYNADANIICFMRLYKNNKNWWECK